MPSQSPSLTIWRQVEARVHLSLPPSALNSPVEYAKRVAFSQLLMRYNASLGGVVVAHTGRLTLDGPPKIIGASPYAHVYATTTLLVFSPPKGTKLLGLVSYVGPDHLGLSVLHSFHAVLPIDKYFIYRGTHWSGRAAFQGQTIRTGCVLRFAVSDIQPTSQGLFQIMGTLSDSLEDSNDNLQLGVVESPPSYVLDLPLIENEQDNGMEEGVDLTMAATVLDLTRKGNQKMLQQNRSRTDPLSLGNGTTFGDPLAPSLQRREYTDRRASSVAEMGSTNNAKKRKRTSLPMQGNTGNTQTTSLQNNVNNSHTPIKEELKPVYFQYREEQDDEAIVQTPSNLKEEDQNDDGQRSFLSLTPGAMSAARLPPTPSTKEKSSKKKSKKSKKKKKRDTESIITTDEVAKDLSLEMSQMQTQESESTSKGNKKEKKKHKKRQSGHIDGNGKVSTPGYNFQEEEWGEMNNTTVEITPKKEDMINTTRSTMGRGGAETETDSRKTTSPKCGEFSYRVSSKVKEEVNVSGIKTEDKWAENGAIVNTQESLTENKKDKKKKKKRLRESDGVGKSGVVNGSGRKKKKKRKLKDALELEKMRNGNSLQFE